MLAVPMKRRGGLSSVIAIARRAPRMSAIWAIMNVAAVAKSGASEMAESSSASRSPLSCGGYGSAIAGPLPLCLTLRVAQVAASDPHFPIRIRSSSSVTTRAELATGGSRAAARPTASEYLR